jgi:hypothetical protein
MSKFCIVYHLIDTLYGSATTYKELETQSRDYLKLSTSDRTTDCLSCLFLYRPINKSLVHGMHSVLEVLFSNLFAH